MSVEKLKEIIFERIPGELFLAHEAFGVDMAITECSDLIRSAGQEHVFGIIQRQARDAFVLSLCNLFERQNNRLPNYSIHTALTYFCGLGNIVVPEQSMVKLEDYICAEIDPSFSWADPVKAEDVPHSIHAHFSEECPRSPLREEKQLDAAFDGIKVLRDKRVAHYEDCDLTELSTTTYENAVELLCFAQTFVNIIGYGFFGFSDQSTAKPAQFSPEKAKGWRQMTKIMKGIGTIDSTAKCCKNNHEKIHEIYGSEVLGFRDFCISLWSLIRRLEFSTFNRRNNN